ncbi:unnamed protein product [Polarella glacialis]|uniref:Uncharacterized protein n=1 Tax=Polarella glacialis TaxID=89957 RepID=A0A813K554_POLGL|nr:unnamed protein product [Polarella glacialis]
MIVKPCSAGLLIATRGFHHRAAPCALSSQSAQVIFIFMQFLLLAKDVLQARGSSEQFAFPGTCVLESTAGGSNNIGCRIVGVLYSFAWIGDLLLKQCCEPKASPPLNSSICTFCRDLLACVCCCCCYCWCCCCCFCCCCCCCCCWD